MSSYVLKLMYSFFYSDMKGIVNQLRNEFMNDIIRITNTAEDDGDPAALESYLVKERGWLLLYVIYKNGIQVGLFFLSYYTLKLLKMDLVLHCGLLKVHVIIGLFGWYMVFNATFNNISVISWKSVLLVEEPGIPRDNHQPAVSHRQTLSHNVVSSAPCNERGLNSQL